MVYPCTHATRGGSKTNLRTKSMMYPCTHATRGSNTTNLSTKSMMYPCTHATRSGNSTNISTKSMMYRRKHATRGGNTTNLRTNSMMYPCRHYYDIMKNRVVELAVWLLWSSFRLLWPKNQVQIKGKFLRYVFALGINVKHEK